ncbi:MAG: preprotein translocase subunit SecA [Gammaproteobacteria bacterium]|nr:preprotein translocase subunit SecA [Gammaproteobacteria bacterium]
MIQHLVSKVFGSRNERILKDLQRKVRAINALEPQLQGLSDEALAAKTAEFKARVLAGATLDSLLIEAFAVVREASRRVLGMRHFDVQLIGGMVLHMGKIAEMKTGEGKTLAAVLPLYLNALSGENVHLVTINDYLVKRDAEQMGRVYGFLGLTTGVIVPGLDNVTRRSAYACDITYGTNNEFGFDYLRDNMVTHVAERVQRKLYFAVVDEVDSILIDEARTPLIISGVMEDSSVHYVELPELIGKLKKQESEAGPGDYTLDEKARQAMLTESGHEHLEVLLLEAKIIEEGESLYSPKNLSLMHYFNAVLRANTLYHKDVDYIVKENEIIIVDPHTGRAMIGRRWSDGLHQAVEAKEGVAIQAENQTLASITFQNYFRIYNKLSGMTGTADTEAYELQQIYNLEVVVIPTHMPMVRKDQADMVYLTADEKFAAIVEDIKACKGRGQPVLVGTASIETSEQLSELLQKENIVHEVLNAKQHVREASIVTEAGCPAAVTIATNMAGRGTDIVLGGNFQAELLGLENPTPEQATALKADWQARHIIGSERHESRRIDNQLRGRSGRQGDPASSQFYLSLEDHLIRIFSGDRLAGMMRRLGMGQGEALQSRLVTKAIANAQKKVENHNFDIRKQLLQYDNVVNDQRKVIYQQRAELLQEDNLSEVVSNLRHDVMESVTERFVPAGSMPEQWDVVGLVALLQADFALDLPIQSWLDEDANLTAEALMQKVVAAGHAFYSEKTVKADVNALAHYEKLVILNSMDTHWREHLARLEHLKQSINLRGYAQKDPKQEYKREAFNLFSSLLDQFKHDVTAVLMKVIIKAPEEAAIAAPPMQKIQYQHQSLNGMGEPEKAADFSKVGRNDPCPCGSGEKFKHCHGKITG